MDNIKFQINRLQISAGILTLILGCWLIFVPGRLSGQKPSDKIDLYYPNMALLEHLIKSEIDSIRDSHHLPFLHSDSLCYLAAKDQGEYLMDLREINHEQNDLQKKTPQDRIEYFGAKGYKVGENIAKIYLQIPFSYQKGIDPPKILKVSTYKEAAEFLVRAWTNSVEHYINILSDTYDVTGVASVINEDDNSLICVQVFAEVDSAYQLKAYPLLFPYEKDILATERNHASRRTSLNPCIQNNKYNIRLPDDSAQIEFINAITDDMPHWYIIYDGSDVYLDMGDNESAGRLFTGKFDGLALEIIPMKDYDCSWSDPNSGIKRNDCLFNGKITKPVYSGRLFRKKLNRYNNENHDFIPYAGRIPDTLNEPCEINVLFLKNKIIYKLIESHHLCGELPDQFTHIPLYNPAITALNDSTLYHSVDNDSLVVSEYRKFFTHIASDQEPANDTSRTFESIVADMDSIQNYLFFRYLNGKINFELIENLPVLFYDKDGYYKRIQPLAKLYYNRAVFKYAYLKESMSDSDFFSILQTLRNFRNPLPVVQYNYLAMLTREMQPDINRNYSLSLLRDISNVIERTEGKLSQSNLDSLRIFYHFQRIISYYKEGKFNFNLLYPSFEFLHDYYKKHLLSSGQRVTLAKFFIYFRLYDFAYDVILPAVSLNSFDKEAFILYLKLYYSGMITRYDEKGYYDNILNASDILEPEDWLGLFEGPCRINFQLLDYEPLRNIYCAKKMDQEQGNR